MAECCGIDSWLCYLVSQLLSSCQADMLATSCSEIAATHTYHHHHRHFKSGLKSENYCKDHCSGGEIMTRKRKCDSESNSFVAAAEQVCLQPVLKHRQRRGRHNIAWQDIPHLCSGNRKGTTSDSWQTTRWNVKLFSGGGPEPASERHVGDKCEWWRQLRWCRVRYVSVATLNIIHPGTWSQ